MIRKWINYIKILFGKETEVDKFRRHGVKIGSNCHLLDVSIDGVCPHLITIGNNVTITHATLIAHDASTKKIFGYTKAGSIKIGNDVFIGWGGYVLGNVKIGNKVIVGAGAVVTKDIPDNSVVIGNPCRVICSYDDYKQRMDLLMNESYRCDVLPSKWTYNEIQEQLNALKKSDWIFIL